MSRSKGRMFANEVRAILEREGHKVDGLFYKSVFFDGRVRAVDCDIFGIADLLSDKDGSMFLHQVTDLSNKGRHIKLILDKMIPCRVWCRCKFGRKVAFRVFFVDKFGNVKEEVMRWKSASGSPVGD